jgi:ATP-dependent DNA helicase DinG
LDIEEVFGESGLLSQKFKGYQRREQQVTMASKIEQNMNSKGVLVAEIPCGSGKSLGYLIPTFQRSLSLGEKTIISTHTVSLQSQLMEKDVKLVADLFGEAGQDVKVVQMKGRSHYLCALALQNAQGDLMLLGDPTFQKVSKWASKTTTGDKSELSFQYPQWEDLTSTQDTCAKKSCPLFKECFYYRQKARMVEADIVVVNHALFFADLKQRDEGKAGILPDYDHVVFDEAHHLEGVATDAFSISVTNRRLHKILDKLARLHEIDADCIQTTRTANDRLFTPFAHNEREYLLQDSTEQSLALKGLARQVRSIVRDLDLMTKEEKEADENANPYQREAVKQSLTRAIDETEKIFTGSLNNNVRWGNTTPPHGKKREPRVEISLTPITVASHLKRALWGPLQDQQSVTLVSATLSTSGTFHFLRSKLGIDYCRELMGDSPFDFQKNALLYVPRHLPEPSQSATPEYVSLVCEEMRRLLELTEGRAFLLFTSKAMMNKVAQFLRETTEHPVFQQGEMGNGAMLEAFRATPGAVLCGVASFWEGVDVQGEQLSLVILDRIPFSVPDSPVQRAKMKHIEDQGGNAFAHHSIPESILRLKQGVGRLIRTVSDRGIVCLLDSRIHTKQYGKRIVNSLPPMSKATKWESVCLFWNGEQE